MTGHLMNKKRRPRMRVKNDNELILLFVKHPVRDRGENRLETVSLKEGENV